MTAPDTPRVTRQLDEPASEPLTGACGSPRALKGKGYFQKCFRRAFVDENSACGRIAGMDQEQKPRKESRAGRPSKGERHGFLIKLSPETIEHIQLIAEVTDNRPQAEVAEAVTSDALGSDFAELVTAVTAFKPYKGRREQIKFHLPMAQARIVFAIKEETGLTYQNILEYLLGEGVKPYDADEMRRAIAAERAARQQEMLPVAV